MLYRVSDKSLLQYRNSILKNAIPILKKQGFEKSPFISSWFGRNNLGDFSYDLACLSNSYLELITIHISKGDKWIKAYLNIFDLFPVPKTLSELNKINGIAFRLAPNNQTQMRLDIELPKRNFINFIFPKKEYKLKFFLTLNKINGIAFRLAPNNQTQMRLDIELPKRNFINFIFPKKEYKLKFFLTCSGLTQRQCELENVLKHDFKNINLKIKMWHNVHKPTKTDWEGKSILWNITLSLMKWFRMFEYHRKQIDTNLKIKMWHNVHKPTKTDWEGKSILWNITLSLMKWFRMFEYHRKQIDTNNANILFGSIYNLILSTRDVQSRGCNHCGEMLSRISYPLISEPDGQRRRQVHHGQCLCLRCSKQRAQRC